MLIYLLEIGHFTLDNASNNRTMMQSLEAILASREIVFDAADRMISCFAHTVNLCSGRAIRAATDWADNDDDTSSSDDDTVATDPIAVARKAVRVIRESGTRRETFNSIIKEGNKKGWFKEEGSSDTIELDELQLLRDVRTRWDSVYFMLQRLRVMRPVWLYALSNTEYLLTNQLHRPSITS